MMIAISAPTIPGVPLTPKSIRLILVVAKAPHVEITALVLGRVARSVDIERHRLRYAMNCQIAIDLKFATTCPLDVG